VLRIYHTSDLHDHRGFVPRLQALRLARPGLLFDCGDSLRGSQTAYRRTEPIVAELAEAGYDAQSIGNREFHYLRALLCARARTMNYPLVCTNLRDVRGRELPFARSLRFTISDGADGSHVVHVLGLLIMQYPAGSPWERVFGWRFLDPWDAVAPYAAQVPEGDALVVLSHLGLSLDEKLARRVPRIDLLLGGHSHDTLAQPRYVNEVPIVHGGPYGKFVSRSELEFAPNRGRFAVRDFALLPLLENQ
jgi:2',3'-cyclic-nucleotide 2'-phosphodiesterase (5'-nucleotidase family)